jgi:predicted DNA-binding transcriptional regulator AlpA
VSEVSLPTTAPIYKPRRGLSRYEAALYIGISTSKFDELVKSGTMPPPIHIGSRVIWDLRKLDDAFDALIQYAPDETDSWGDV